MERSAYTITVGSATAVKAYCPAGRTTHQSVLHAMWDVKIGRGSEPQEEIIKRLNKGLSQTPPRNSKGQGIILLDSKPPGSTVESRLAVHGIIKVVQAMKWEYTLNEIAIIPNAPDADPEWDWSLRLLNEELERGCKGMKDVIMIWTGRSPATKEAFKRNLEGILSEVSLREYYQRGAHVMQKQINKHKARKGEKYSKGNRVREAATAIEEGWDHWVNEPRSEATSGGGPRILALHPTREARSGVYTKARAGTEDGGVEELKDRTFDLEDRVKELGEENEALKKVIESKDRELVFCWFYYKKLRNKLQM